MESKMCLMVLGLCLGLVLGEQCTTNTDCTSTQCAAGNSVLCQHPDGQGIVNNGGLCTCESSLGCVYAADCYGTNSELNCPDNMRHCYDNKCICDRFAIGGLKYLV